MKAKDKKAKKKAKPIDQATNTKEIKAALFADYVRRYK
jgi:hypothetical protein